MLNPSFAKITRTYMIEVFKTNVTDSHIASRLVNQLHERFIDCKANFDLDDCDLILRIQYDENKVNVNQFIALLNSNGFNAIILTDD